MTSYNHITTKMLRKMLKQLQQKMAAPHNFPNLDEDKCLEQIANITEELERRQ